MKKVFLFLILISVGMQLTAQINKHGLPFVKNYTISDYDAAEQNWAVCEDKRGFVYVGNNDDGILEFNGTQWNKIPISNGSIIRSLVYANDGIIYVGGVDEFGYLAPDKHGKMGYMSLLGQVDSIHLNFKNVWKVFNIGNDIYFCTNKLIFKYNGKKLKKVYENTEGAFLCFHLFDKIYWGNYYRGGLFVVENDEVVPAIGGEFYIGKDVFTMLPWSGNEILVTTMEHGIFIYNRITGLSKTLGSLGENFSLLNNELMNSQVYNGIKLSSGNYALATLDKGCIIFSQQGELIYKLDKENSLLDNTVINLYESSDKNLWLGLNTGISCVELKTPFTKLGQAHGLEGIILDMLRFDGTLYISTTAGFFALGANKGNMPVFRKIQGLNHQVWKIALYTPPGPGTNRLLLATGYGLWELQGSKLVMVDTIPYYAKEIYQSKYNPEMLYFGHRGGIGRISFKDNRWHIEGKINDIIDEVENITEDSKGNLWLGTSLNGAIKLNPDLSYVRYNESNGLSGIKGICNVRGKIVCPTKKGLFYFNESIQLFEKYDGFGEKYYQSQHEVINISVKNENEFWVVSVDPATNYEYIEQVTISQDRIVNIENVPFKRLVRNSFRQVNFDPGAGIWILTSDALYNYKEKLSEEFSKSYQTVIGKVMHIDSVVFWGTYYKDTSNLVVDFNQPVELKKVLPYRENAIQFNYSTPFFPGEEIKYSYKLEGFEEQWSAWEVRSERGYTNLDEGHYTFMVKARNIYGIESETAKYEFTIKPPLYRTILAYICYGVILVVVIVIIVKVYTRRLELEKIRLEQIVKERTEQVVRQKDEIEKQRDTIAEKNRSITDSIEYASRIQNAILPSKEYADEILPEHFILFRPRDIVSGDFYWLTKKDNMLVIIAADCTGHGVPGAFMSMLGVSFLNEIVNRHEITSACAILNNLRDDVKKTLGQEGKEGEAKDGMDLSLCIVDMENMKLQYAGAYNPLYLFRDNELVEIKADRMPIGIYVKEKDSFTNNEMGLKKNDVFYLFSDGYQDQFGGDDGRKFKTKTFKELLLNIHHKPMAEQKEILNNTIDEWRGKWEQVDDIIVMGIRV